ncbi:superoxide dismutase family protein [Natranaerobius thermophilus]|uniref:Superoxide dismutase copper/zinc binding n=1 Tax=Natranaerobius thermophilus (strain ATCC BAA-1301 / DSM 18059 / JW/NM-WN-LF) TaxID=457570 RepID=B2A7C9_NATTJ|nr:superoxide dismutase family protein [Natranaerobius thermophilus]ACB84323.1 superoxide dismutase copper/zinc binding [Natranaerobius thermophilus JW/NM-WN-LF]
MYDTRNIIKVAMARIKGGSLAPDLKGIVTFDSVKNGTVICADIEGLPSFQRESHQPPIGPHGFHLHEIGTCKEGNPEDPFQAAGGHWDPDNQPHGNHAGDFPVLFSHNGIARTCFFTSRFHVQDIIDKAVIIHESPDDFRTNPTGKSGRRLACGVVKYEYIDIKDHPMYKLRALN